MAVEFPKKKCCTEDDYIKINIPRLWSEEMSLRQSIDAVRLLDQWQANSADPDQCSLVRSTVMFLNFWT